MKARMFREEIAVREEKEDYYKNRDIDFIGSYYPDKTNWKKKGFFNLYHGIKENEENSIESLVKIAEDSQAIYEFLQNAVDANADKFFVFYNEKYFAVINNGDKFSKDGIESILNIAQSTKTNDEKRIGKFGVGFKLIHRLVGKSSGLTEIIKEYKGPVLFSWDKTYISDLLNNNLTKIDNHWLFKIIYTNFPCALDERIKGNKYEEINPFDKSELNEMIKFVKIKLDESNWDRKDFNTGSLFFLRLGNGKKSLLAEEENNLKMGAEYSLSILNSLYEEKDTVSEMRINNLIVKKKDMEIIQDDKFLLLFPSSQEKSLSYDKTKNEKVSFFKFFPMGDQLNDLNFIIHSHLFEIETNRRKIQHSPGNKELLQTIAKRLTKKLDKLYKNNNDIFYSILLNLYLSDLETSSGDFVIQENFSQILYDYIQSHIPTIKGKTVNDATQVKIVKSKLQVPLIRNDEFYFSNQKYDRRIQQQAKKLLNIKEWNILDILMYDDIEDWVHSLTLKDYEVFLFELNKYLTKHQMTAIETKRIFLMSNGTYASKQEIDRNNKMFFSGLFKTSIEEKLKKLNFIPTMANFKKHKNISISISQEIEPSYFDDKYSVAQVNQILEIFKEENISNFALIKNTKNSYSFIPNEANISIKDSSFREFLEKTYELNEMNYYLVPEEFQSSINKIYRIEKKDNEIKEELLNSDQHEELINYINTNDLKNYFLNTLNNILLDSDKIYNNKSFEYKVLKLTAEMGSEQYKSKILVDKKSIVRNLKSNRITFKYGKANNEKVVSDQYATEDFDFTKRVEEFIEKNDFNDKIKSIFKTEEGDKEDVYQYIKDKILANPHSKNMINTFPRLKFIMMYALELEKNLFEDFSGIELMSGADDTYRSFYNLLDTKISISIDQIVKMNIFTIKDIFKNSISNNYYISDTSIATHNEKLPQFFYRSENKNILDAYVKLGLVINKDLEKIRKKILERKEVKQKELTQLKDTELETKATLEFFATQDIVIPIDKEDMNYKNISTLYAMAEIEDYIVWNYYPIMRTKTEFSIEKISTPYKIRYITKEKLNSNNKSFQKRLTQEVKNELIYSVFLKTSQIPNSWEELKENSNELKKEKEKEILKKDKDISMRMSKTIEGSKESNWYIGWKGEKHVYLLLLDKFKNRDLEVIWHNENSKSLEDDKGSIDIEIKDTKGDTIHNVEVKTTIKSSSQNQTLAFYMSGGQFDAATSWGRDTHLVFVTGIEDNEPRCLYMNFDNEWLDSNTMNIDPRKEVNVIDDLSALMEK